MIIVEPIDAKPFHREPDGTFVAEASDLTGFRLSQIYDDACDVGLAIRDRRGRVWPFALSGTDESGGDIQAWRFLSCYPTPGVRMVIFND